MKRKPKAYKREQRKEQVILQLRIWLQNGHAKEATSYKLARALELEPSPHFRGILNEMVTEGKLYCIQRAQSGRYGTFFYLLVDKASYHGEIKKRRINITCKGVVAAQLEMWT